MRSSRAGAQQRTGAATSLPRECHCHWCWCLPSRSRWSCGRLCGLHSLALEHGQQPCWQVHPKQLGSVANSHYCASNGFGCASPELYTPSFFNPPRKRLSAS